MLNTCDQSIRANTIPWVLSVTKPHLVICLLQFQSSIFELLFKVEKHLPEKHSKLWIRCNGFCIRTLTASVRNRI